MANKSKNVATTKNTSIETSREVVGLSGTYMIETTRLLIELRQISGYDLPTANHNLPIFRDYRYFVPIILTQHQSLLNVYRLVNLMDDRVTDFLNTINPSSTLYANVIQNASCTLETQFMLGRFAPKISSNEKITDIFSTIATEPTINQTIKKAFDITASTNTGVPIQGIRDVLRSSAPTTTSCRKYVLEGQREFKWNTATQSKPSYQVVLKRLGNDQSQLTRFKIALDQKNANTDELQSFCLKVVKHFPSLQDNTYD